MRIYKFSLGDLCRGAVEPRKARCGQLPIFYTSYICVYIIIIEIRRVSVIYINKIRSCVYDTYYADLPCHILTRRQLRPWRETDDYSVEKTGERWISACCVLPLQMSDIERRVTMPDTNIERWPPIRPRLKYDGGRWWWVVRMAVIGEIPNSARDDYV